MKRFIKWLNKPLNVESTSFLFLVFLIYGGGGLLAFVGLVIYSLFAK